MARKNWWPSAQPQQLLTVENFKAKIAEYVPVLGWTPAQLTEAVTLCDTIIGSITVTEQCRLSMQAQTQWRDAVLNGDPNAGPAPPAPVFPVVGTVNYPQGAVRQFQKMRDIITLNPNFNDAMGEDLGILGPESSPVNPDQVRPQFKSITSQNYTVNVTASMQGMDAMRVEYAPQGGSFEPVGFFTNTPGSFTVVPTNPGQPENGQVRAIYYKKNAPFGNYSANYPVTVAS